MSRSRLRAPAVLVAACLSCGQGGGDAPSIDAPPVIPPPVLPTFRTISVGDPVLGEIAAQQVSRYGAAVTPGVEYVVALLGPTGSVALHVYGDDASFELPRGCFSARAGPRTQDCSLVSAGETLHFAVEASEPARYAVAVLPAPGSGPATDGATVEPGLPYDGSVGARAVSRYTVQRLSPGMNITVSVVGASEDVDLAVDAASACYGSLRCDREGIDVAPYPESCSFSASGTEAWFSVFAGEVAADATYWIVVREGHGVFRVVASEPAAGTTTADPDLPVTVTFSERLDAASITDGSFSLQSGGAPVAGSRQVVGNVATLLPAAPLAWGATHAVGVSAAVRDAAGGALASPHSFSFTTRLAMDFALEARPALVATARGESAGVELLFAVLAGLPEPAALTLTGCPPAATCIPLPEVGLRNTDTYWDEVPAEAVSLWISTSPATPIGTYAIRVEARTRTATRTADVTLMVVDPPPAGMVHALWGTPAPGVGVAPGFQTGVTGLGDGAGGAFVGWLDGRTGHGDSIVRVQHLDRSGAPLWEPQGVAAATPPPGYRLAQREFALVPDDTGGVLVLFSDGRSGRDDIYGQRLDELGRTTWGEGGVPICTAGWWANNKRSVVAAADGAGGAVLAWQEVRNGFDFSIYAQRVRGDGSLAWESEGVAVAAVDGQHMTHPAIAPDGAGGAIVGWWDFASGGVAQRLDATGALRWGAGVQYGPRSGMLVSDGAGGAITVIDGIDVLAQRIDRDGGLAWGGGVVVCDAPGDQRDARVAADDSGGILVVWTDQRDPTRGQWIVAQRLGPDGAALWTAGGVPVFTSNGYGPALAADGTGGAFVAWSALAGDSLVDPIVSVQRLDASGAPAWGSGFEAYRHIAGHYGFAPAVVSDGSGGAIVLWADDILPAGWMQDVYAQHIGASP